MLKIISDAQTVARCKRLFIRRFRSFWDERTPVTIGHQGASFAARAAWSDRLALWMASREDGGRFSHLFGVNRPEPGGHAAIACEINIPHDGVDRRIGGGFARDTAGRIYVIHRGRIGGGQTGIGKSLFERCYRGVWTDLDDGGPAATVAVVGEVGSPRFPRQVAQFVHKVARMKEEALSADSLQLTMVFDEGTFQSGLTGERWEPQGQNLARLCDHTLVVRDLAATLRRLGFKPGNNPYEDLFVLDGNGRAIAVFQVVTDNRLKKVHEGATRLFFSTLTRPRTCRFFLAVPEPLDATLQRRMEGLAIRPLVYAWRDNGEAVFPDIEGLLPPESSN